MARFDVRGETLEGVVPRELDRASLALALAPDLDRLVCEVTREHW